MTAFSCRFSIILLLLPMSLAFGQLPDFAAYPVYTGNDLGVTYAPSATTFTVWSPAAQAMRLRLYTAGQGGKAVKRLKLKRQNQGTWSGTLPGNWEGRYYTFQAKVNGKWLAEVPDPYAKAVGVNGRRGMVVDLTTTNPENWQYDVRPPLAGPQDIILYELHVRDLTIHPSAGAAYPGKFLGLAERGNRSREGLSTGLDHIKEMGVTHVHILPAFDFRSLDETRLSDGKYNWGYDPQNYNTPEGSYATDPYDGRVRIREFKQLIKTLHDNGIRVIMDVVYNHTGFTQESLFNQLVPGYYYRQNAEGGFSDAAACGNEVASERAMVRKFILESVLYWAKEYHVDGFRFDLMGIHDIETMNAVSDGLRAIDPSLFVYGEGWTAGGSPLPDEERALKANTAKLHGIAAFSDEIRDAIKGHVFSPEAQGFVSGKGDLRESLKFGIVGATFHPQVNYGAVNYAKSAWAPEPTQSIVYASCHDNHTLWDRLAIANPDATEEERIAMHKLALGIVLTSQGVPFLHAGSEFLRTKQGVENSFESPDAINQIDWSRKAQYQDVVRYVKNLILLRKLHPAFRMGKAAQIRQQLTFQPTETDQVLVYTIDGQASGDNWKHILVAFNGSSQNQGVSFPYAEWQLAVNDQEVYPNGSGKIKRRAAILPPHSMLVLFTDAYLPEPNDTE